MTIEKGKKIKHLKYSLKRKSIKLNNTNIKYIQIGGDIACNSVLGAGGFGIAYKCVDDSQPNNPIVAVLKTSKVKDNTVLQNEIDILSKLPANNNVVHYFTGDEIQKQGLKTMEMPHYYLEYCANGDLKSYLSKQQSNSQEQIFTQIFTQVFAGLQHLYNNNIIHADIKEENILVCGDNSSNPTFKIADFGISIDLNTFGESIDRRKLFKNGSIGYIPMYMRYTTYFRDLYALYCILYKMITNKPFNDTNTIAGAVSARIVENTDFSDDQKGKYKIKTFMAKLIDLQNELLEAGYFNPDILVSKPNTQEQAPTGYVMASPGLGGYYKASGGSRLVNGYIFASPGSNTTEISQQNTQNFDIINQPLLIINKTSDHELYRDIYNSN